MPSQKPSEAGPAEAPAAVSLEPTGKPKTAPAPADETAADTAAKAATPAAADPALPVAPIDTTAAGAAAAAQSAAPPAAQQVANAVRGLVADTRSSLRTAASEATAITGSVVTAGAVKSLTVQLDPDHLGPVSITVRLQANAMDIRIAVSNPQALHTLEQDRHVLSAAVQALGGSADSLQLGGATLSGGDGQLGNQQQPSSNPQRHDAFSSDASSTSRQGQGQNRSGAASRTQVSQDDTTPAPSVAPRAADGSLYL